MTKVCIVGGGLAGAAAATVLDEQADVTVFEGNTIGGRMASRERAGRRYDLGANYLELADDELEAFVTDAAGDVLDEIEPPVWRFDASGDVSPDRTEQHTRYSATEGLDVIPRAMFGATDATVREETTVSALARTDRGWTVTADGESREFDAVVLAVPAGAASLLIETADWDDQVRERLQRATDSIPHQTMDTVALGYDFELERPYFGLVSLDGVYDVAWVSLEGCKPGHVPEGESVVIVQLGPAWATTHPHVEANEAAEAAADRAAELLEDERLAEPDWWDYQRWGNAVPTRGPDADVLAVALDHDLALAGDWVQGMGRTRAAIRSGIEAGERLL